MFSKNLLVGVCLFGLVQISLIGCGQKSSGNKVTTSRSKNKAAKTADPAKAGTGAAATAGAATDPAKPAAVGGGASQGAGSASAAGATSPQSVAQQNAAITKKNCQAYADRVQKEGWELTLLGANSFLTPKGSLLKEPVLVLMNSRSELSADDSIKLLKIAKDQQFDPIYMDVAGTGCSDPLPDLNRVEKTEDLQKFKSLSLAASIEDFRKAKKVDKLKVWAHGNASLIGLRLVEKFPATLKSLHFADFVFSDQPASLMKKRLIKQSEDWQKFKAFSKKNDLEISDDLMKKVEATLDKQVCTAEQKICKKPLLNVLVTFLNQEDAKWMDAVKSIKILSEGEIPETLNQKAKSLQKRFLFDQFVRATDLDADSSLSACDQALKDSTIIEALKTTPINSCGLESALKEDYKKSLQSKITHQKIDYALIKKNLSEKEIKLFLAIGERSVMNPLSAVEDMSRLIGEEVVNENLITPGDGSDLFTNETLLQSL